MFNKIIIVNLIINLSICASHETIVGDECVCDGRCKECVIRQTEQHCKLCSGYYGLDFKNLGIDNYNIEENIQLSRRTCVCPANYRQMKHNNSNAYVSSEIVFVRLECDKQPTDDKYCVGINPQLFFIGINFADYWIIIGSILTIILILCCAIYSILRNHWCFNSEQLMTMYEQNFPLSSMRNSGHNYSIDNPSSDVTRDTSYPPTYDEVFTRSCNSNSHPLSKHTFNVTLNAIETNDHLPTYEDAVRTDPNIKAEDNNGK